MLSMPDNDFDRAMAKADHAILRTMGREFHIQAGGRSVHIRGVLDEAESDVLLKKGGGTFHDVAPRLFVRTRDIAGVSKKSRVECDGVVYWVVSIGPDDNGFCYLTLARGEPGTSLPVIDGWSKKSTV
ncbi:head-tail joining protein [Citrobacter braakii]|uniref:head-tail joining protein n=1 Tax=Citrobacter braakii TaxID=57706 RepID=UPI002B24DB2B|nr:head-tail joining protein [Citrobacter braakii]MEB0968360.1 head-tail joining protein [Citrobacter braakii]